MSDLTGPPQPTTTPAVAEPSPATPRAIGATNLQRLACDIRSVNKANGWGLNFDPSRNDQEIPGYLALEHSEVVEAQTADLPDHAIRELGDVLVRALDFCELVLPGALQDFSLELDQPVLAHDLRRFSWDASLFGLHRWITASLEIYRKEPAYLRPLLEAQVGLIRETWAIMLTLGADPLAVMQEIVAANRQRGYRHGGRRT